MYCKAHLCNEITFFIKKANSIEEINPQNLMLFLCFIIDNIVNICYYIRVDKKLT